MAFNEDIRDLEDQSVNKDFTPPGATEESLKMFADAVTNSQNLEDLAHIVEDYGRENDDPEMQIQASKIRKGELPTAITRNHGIRSRYMELAHWVD